MTTTNQPRTPADPTSLAGATLELLGPDRTGEYEVSIGRGTFTGTYGRVILRGNAAEIRTALAGILDDLAEIEHDAEQAEREYRHDRWADETYG